MAACLSLIAFRGVPVVRMLAVRLLCLPWAAQIVSGPNLAM